MMRYILTFPEIAQDAEPVVGGKGLSLGRLAQAGLPVPPGFCITTHAYRQFGSASLSPESELGVAIATAYRTLGAGLVAVRSSAVGEDGSELSFAGQQETILGVEGEPDICEAVARCWASLRTERAVAYRKKQGIGEEGLAMAVVVQRLVPAESAGVLFTRDPLDPTGQRLLIEASWGLGESVVSGRVQPDRFHLDRATGKVLERHIGSKSEQVTARGREDVPADMRARACLEEPQLTALTELARRVEEHYREPRDIEWAWAGGTLWLLQARPITAADAAEREQVRQAEIAVFRHLADPAGTVWSRYNLSEILPEPTPLTWAIVRRFMSGKGGFGLMYRDLGFDPDPSLDDDGIFDLIAGRPYCNLSREARMHFRLAPYDHNFEALKEDPTKALYPTPGLNFGRVGCLGLFLVPFRLIRVMGQQSAAQKTQKELTATFPDHFRKEIAPTFLRDCAAEEATSLDGLDDAALLARLETWVQRTLIDFARDSLKPTALAAISMAAVQARLTAWLGAERAEAVSRELVVGVHPDPEADLPRALEELAAGKLDRAGFLANFGHRGPQEMELSRPRWREDPAAVDQLLRARPGGNRTESAAHTETVLAGFLREKPLADKELTALRADLASLHGFLGLRETAKHYLMRGYALIRRVLVELDRRHGLQGGLFFLLPEELPLLLGQASPTSPENSPASPTPVGEAARQILARYTRKPGPTKEELRASIAQRKRHRSIALSLEMPPVLFSDDLDAIGRPIETTGGTTLQGVPLSPGVAEAAALVLTEPPAEVPAGPYVLVCPSTDPAWVPLFGPARALVMETGGVLSHGAIVAREFGLPAVAGLAGITRRLKTGDRLKVDGSTGVVTLLE
jgi:pyruvate,water dikinase